MRTINIRQLQRNFYLEMRDLPVLVKRRNRKLGQKETSDFVCIIFPYRQDLVVADSDLPAHPNLAKTSHDRTSDDFPPQNLKKKSFLNKLFGK